jgi:tyrosyl-tRNA synthetase
MLNKKGSEEFINKEVKAWGKTIKAIGLKCEIVLGSSFQYKKEYQYDIMKLAQATTINRGLRSMQEIARDIENATISQLLYPLMQVADIKYLNVDVALGGLEQRKVHMIGKDLARELNYNFIPFHTALITSLKGPGEKMSKSIQGSGISVTDSFDEIKKTIKGAYCPEKISQDNPILQISNLILFPHLKELKISRPEKFGGNVLYKNYKNLESDFVQGKLHPLDLKTAVAEALEKIIFPIRNNFK